MTSCGEDVDALACLKKKDFIEMTDDKSASLSVPLQVDMTDAVENILGRYSAISQVQMENLSDTISKGFESFRDTLKEMMISPQQR